MISVSCPVCHMKLLGVGHFYRCFNCGKNYHVQVSITVVTNTKNKEVKKII